MSGYRIVTPIGWDRIPLDARRQPAVERIVRRQFAGVDDAPHIRTQLTELLSAEAARAAESGGIELYVSNLLAGPVPLESTLVVGVADLGGAGVPDLDELAAGLAAGDDDRTVESSAVAELPAGRAVRRASLLRAATETVADQDVDVPTTYVVEWFLPTPTRTGMLLLTFSTMLVPIRQAFAELFDAVAGTLQWRVPVPDTAGASGT